MYTKQKLLIANRGEIAVRIIRTAKELGLRTVAIYTPSDAVSPHVTLADEAVALPLETASPDSSESKAYLAASSIISICQQHSVTLLHPGYGFLAENHEFATRVLDAGVTWLGPRPEIIKAMGLKHEARAMAIKAGVDVVPGSEGLVHNEEDALVVARSIGLPVIMKATAGGGGMGMVICENEDEVKYKFASTKTRAQALFGHDGVFFEKYFPSARHIEVQIFGNGLGHVIHMGERECSVQRRHQKVIEETPSPLLSSHPDVRERMCTAAVALCKSINYGSAGTVEFLVDDQTRRFYFLEMNTRIQVEHPVTEETFPGLDIVRLMIQQGIAEREAGSTPGGLDSTLLEMDQRTYTKSSRNISCAYAIEARVYCENPSEGFRPSPGILQCVDLNRAGWDWLRVDGWISTGTMVTPFFDPLLCKLIVTGFSREETLARLESALNSCSIDGPPNNLQYLRAIIQSKTFRDGEATTKFLDTFDFLPRAMTISSAGLETTVQDLPGRRIGMGLPRSGPMDSLAFMAANLLVGNLPATEGLEVVVVPGSSFSVLFYAPTVVAVTGKESIVKVDGKQLPMWSSVCVPAGRRLEIVGKVLGPSIGGFRVYVAIRGGFPSISNYLGSKSTSMGLGGYQGRSLRAGDQLDLGDCTPHEDEAIGHILSTELIPVYPSHWVIYVLPGPHDDVEYLTSEGISRFYSTHWRVSASSNRMGIRLESPDKFIWARTNGGEGGSHPSNILDNGYAHGTININGDTPVILTNEGPDMGGYVCLCTVASSEMWKLGQLSPGCTLEFRRVSWNDTRLMAGYSENWLRAVQTFETSTIFYDTKPIYQTDFSDTPKSPKLHVIAPQELESKSIVTFRQAGDSAILVEFGYMELDFALRARIHAFELELRKREIPGLLYFSPCIRSTMCHFDPSMLSQTDLLGALIDVGRTIPGSMEDMQFPGRRITFPIVLDDRWNREALQRYMRTTRDKAVYLPSNVEYLAKNNGLDGGVEEALQRLIQTDWLVFGVGFYLACPFLVPIDPRCRLVGQKMNPSRTYTPRGAIGIAGLVAAIYPVESPGGYQLYGRTLPAWQTWGKGPDFDSTTPWLLSPFDQVHFSPVSEEEYLKLEKDFDAGRYKFEIESTVFSMSEYTSFVTSLSEEVSMFKKKQAQGVALEESRERELLAEWESGKKTSNQSDEGSGQENTSDTKFVVESSLFASVWKINCSLGGVIQSAEEVVVILEAMKTEINIKAGELNVGRKVQGFGKGVKEGALVRPGDVLVVLD